LPRWFAKIQISKIGGGCPVGQHRLSFVHMSANAKKLKRLQQGRQLRSGHNGVTLQEQAAKRRFAFLNKVPPGPHKKWASFIRRILFKLGLEQKDAPRELRVGEGVYKKAINGRNISGYSKNNIENNLTAHWEVYRKNHLEEPALSWPSYDDDIPIESLFNAELKPTDPLAVASERMKIILPEIIYPKTAVNNSNASAMNDAIDGSDSNLAEGAWPLHQKLEKSYAEIARTIDNALAEGNNDLAFQEFRRSLFYSGYHEQWQTRRMLTQKILKAKLGPRDAGWVRLKAEAYMEMELGDFSLAKAAIARALELFKQGDFPEGVGLCFRYLGDLQAKFGSIGQALGSKVESLKHLKGIPALEAQLEMKLIQLQHLTEPSNEKIKKLAELGARFKEIQSWRYWLTEIEKAKTIAAMGGWADALTVAKYVEFAFRSEIKMERTRKSAVRLIGELEKRLSR
jgi:hypothetical protein